MFKRYIDINGGLTMTDKDKKCKDKKLKEKCVKEIMGFFDAGYADFISLYSGVCVGIDIICKYYAVRVRTGATNRHEVICNDIIDSYNVAPFIKSNKFIGSVLNVDKRNVYHKQYRKYVKNAIDRYQKRIGGVEGKDIIRAIEIFLSQIAVR